MDVRVKRVQEPAERGDGHRVPVDRLWPRGVSKSQAELDEWLRYLAPSDELRCARGGTLTNGASRARTGDLWLAKPALFQLSYGPF
jgi:uncharacterized protein YeaO (DUF488 family)